MQPTQGGLSSDYSHEIEFNPTVLAKKGVVVVTAGQRLNVFGYLSLPQLSAEQGGINGNYGECVMSKAFELGGKPLATAADFYAKAKEVLGEEIYNKCDFENVFPVKDEDANVLSRHLAVEGMTGFGGNMKNLYFGEYRAKKFPGAKTYSHIFSHITPSVPDDM